MSKSCNSLSATILPSRFKPFSSINRLNLAFSSTIAFVFLDIFKSFFSFSSLYILDLPLCFIDLAPKTSSGLQKSIFPLATNVFSISRAASIVFLLALNKGFPKYFVVLPVSIILCIPLLKFVLLRTSWL